MTACARFVKVNPDEEDVKQAGGPATSTTAGEQEAAAAAAADAAELVKWLSVIDEDTADAAELSTLPSLQRLLERMETQAGRFVANETYSVVEKGGFSALDEVPFTGHPKTHSRARWEGHIIGGHLGAQFGSKSESNLFEPSFE